MFTSGQVRFSRGRICLHCHDRTGEPVLDEEDDPVISMTLSQLKICPTVVALAGGPHEVEAIDGALAGGYLDVLITDCVTAAALAKRQPIEPPTDRLHATRVRIRQAVRRGTR